MHFVDECELRVEAGDGGDGAIAFRREKFVPFGGPAGGDGGRGGSVVLLADEGRTTLADVTHLPVVRAARGENGGGRDCNGRGGKDVTLRVPLGTIVVDADSGERLGELTEPRARLVIAKGGNGGRGNRHFATSTDRAPRHAEPGSPGERRHLRLELKLMADVAILGYPNVGKSTFIRSVTRARPKVADYPFTTLQPHLGVVSVGETHAGLGRSFVIADIPGLIEGAADGHGLGHRFLRHVERTRVLLHLVTLTAEPERDPITDYQVLRRELQRFNPQLSQRPELVAISQADRSDVREAYPDLCQRFERELGIRPILVSAVSRHGLDPLLHALLRQLDSESPGSSPPVPPTGT